MPSYNLNDKEVIIEPVVMSEDNRPITSINKATENQVNSIIVQSTLQDKSITKIDDKLKPTSRSIIDRIITFSEEKNKHKLTAGLGVMTAIAGNLAVEHLTQRLKSKADTFSNESLIVASSQLVKTSRDNLTVNSHDDEKPDWKDLEGFGS